MATPPWWDGATVVAVGATVVAVTGDDVEAPTLLSGVVSPGVVDAVGVPFFVKPANTGSSVGISRVSTADAFGPALEEAFKYDHKSLLEEGIALFLEFFEVGV